MLQELKKQSLKRVLPGVIVLALLAAVCMALGGAGVVNLVKGPDWLYDYYGEDLEGRYVEADVYVVYDWYAETTSRREGSSVETTKSRDFIIDANDLEYIALEVPAADLKQVEQQMYDSWDYLDDVTDDLTTYYHIEGTVERMDAETLGLYTEFLADGGTLDEAFLPYIIKQGKVGGADKTFSLFMFVAAVAMLVWLAVLLVKALTGGYQKAIKRRALAEGDLPLLEERRAQRRALGAVQPGRQNGPAGRAERALGLCAPADPPHQRHQDRHHLVGAAAHQRPQGLHHRRQKRGAGP